MADITELCQAISSAEVRTTDQSRTRGKGWLAEIIPRERSKWSVHEQSMLSDARSGQQWGNRAAIGTMVHRNRASERGLCENDVQSCTTTMGGEIQLIAKNQNDTKSQIVNLLECSSRETFI